MSVADSGDPLDPRLIPHIRRVVADLVSRNWDALVADGLLEREAVDGVAAVLDRYPGHLVAIPDDALGRVDVYRYNDGSGFHIDVPLWTNDESPSDLEARLDARHVDGDFRVRITGVLVP